MSEDTKSNPERETPAPIPRRVEWAGPEGWTVWADEDGVHLRCPKGSGLEMPDVERLFSLWQEARMSATSGRIAAPRPPTRGEGSHLHPWREEYAEKRAIRAIKAEFDTDPTTPF